MSPQEIQDKIRQIQNELEQSNDTSYDYLPDVLRDLRHYILQVHALYEQTLNIIILTEYLTRRPMEANAAIFAQISFTGKLRLIKEDTSGFPFEMARQLNKIRNNFVHREGAHLRAMYPTAGSRLETYEYLKESKDALNEYYEHLS